MGEVAPGIAVGVIAMLAIFGVLWRGGWRIVAPAAALAGGLSAGAVVRNVQGYSVGGDILIDGILVPVVMGGAVFLVMQGSSRARRR